MPPNTQEVLPPEGRGNDVPPYLESFGLCDVIPSIRSSDDALARKCPFYYYLRRRLSLVPALSADASRALSVGSYFHLFAEHQNAASPKAAFNDELSKRLDEITALCEPLSKDPKWAIERERQYAAEGLACYEGAASLRIPGNRFFSRGIFAYLDDPSTYRTLGRELTLSYRHPDFSRTVLTIQIDRLLYNIKTDTLWIVDYKTTSQDTVVRAETCPYEFQTRHYIAVTEWMLNHLVDRYELPRSAKVGGMMHVIVQKPRIRMSDQDRPYHLVSDGKTGKQVYADAVPTYQGGRIVSWNCQSRQRKSPYTTESATFDNENDATEWLRLKASKKPTKHYSGEPSFDLYAARYRSFYNDTGPDFYPVNISFTPTDAALDEDGRAEYLSSLRSIYALATRPPIPVLFPRSGEGAKEWGGNLSPYAPFYRLHPKDWPEYVLEAGFVQAPRDEENQKDHSV